MRRRHQVGFTLLEAVVAMTLLAVVGGALLAWLNSGYRSMQRVDAAEMRIETARLAMAYLERINPMLEPVGSVQLGAYRLEWRSSPLSEPKPVVGRHGGRPGIYDAALYRVDANVVSEDGPPLTLTLEAAGYARVPGRTEDGG
ncbi:hypothetical protein D9M68_141850 [compost metagenome]